MELESPEGVYWILQSSPGVTASNNLSDPTIGFVEMKTQDLDAQVAFYQDVLGMRIIDRQPERVTLAVAADRPPVILLPGGQKQAIDVERHPDPALAQPIFLGFMARDLKQSAARIRKNNVSILKDVEHHDWNGTDMILADADGNAVQIFELDEPHEFGSQRAVSSDAER
ncbi:MAG: VOC family protein [Pirellulales bacterium]